MSGTKEYFFDSVDDLVKYLMSKYGKLSPLKLQKGLYFLFGYYGGRYGKENENSEIQYNLPKYLFPATFLAWDYGPVIDDVYKKNKAGIYDEFVSETNTLNEMKEFYFKDLQSKEVENFINELFSEVNTTSDFNLVDRSHEDRTWQVAYESGYNVEMNKEDIVEEYSIHGRQVS
ncbi:DUF4065 domain-containing protein [Macrococcus equipercicus]|uniref:DUF4065 domain-containing protein n=1 Tax=Macrococcus equipercicus TaxID=69967 RepID=A0ABQ6RB74_9STAP|nr:type II toxin-antitoxin system antitoxin SocA domain-containing protein [Macrococcus equipercicus]KAA1042492.1 DUF4065 domain-containing protein [Macrococcus equipercicus]